MVLGCGVTNGRVRQNQVESGLRGEDKVEEGGDEGEERGELPQTLTEILHLVQACNSAH